MWWLGAVAAFWFFWKKNAEKVSPQEAHRREVAALGGPRGRRGRRRPETARQRDGKGQDDSEAVPEVHELPHTEPGTQAVPSEEVANPFPRKADKTGKRKLPDDFTGSFDDIDMPEVEPSEDGGADLGEDAEEVGEEAEQVEGEDSGEEA